MSYFLNRCYGEKIVVAASGEKGDVSKIVEKLTNYLETHVRMCVLPSSAPTG
jgi:hypothetical protein